jgi:putative phosphoribosyl transferase
MQMRFRDRSEAGRVLAELLKPYAGRPNLLVLALPRGGVPVAFEVARALHAPLGIMLVRKLGVPGHEELAMGAIAAGGIRVISEDVVRTLSIPDHAIAIAAAAEGAELKRQERQYLLGRSPLEVAGRTVVLVDDGLATGATMRAAIEAVEVQRPERVVVAVPVAAQETCEGLRHEADDVICARTPDPFHAVALWYDDFSQISDAEVSDLLQKAAALQPA